MTRGIVGIGLILLLASVAGCSDPVTEIPEPDNVVVIPPVTPPPSPSVFVAASTGDFDLLHSLLEDGAALDTLNDNGLTPLQSAVIAGHLDMVSTLLSLGMDANGAPSRKDPPLNLAIDLVSNWESTEAEQATGLRILKALITHGADPTAHLNGYNSAVQHAMDVECEDCVTLMRELAFSTGVK